MQTLRSAWAEPIGWALIATGLTLATRTLGSHGRRTVGRTGERSLGTLDVDNQRCAAIEPDNQWQRLAQMVQSEIDRAELLPDLQARAIDAVEAADEAVTSLLAECRLIQSRTDAAAVREEREPAPTPVARPLAA